MFCNTFKIKEIYQQRIFTRYLRLNTSNNLEAHSKKIDDDHKLIPGAKPQNVSMTSEEEKINFISTFSNIVKDLTMANNDRGVEAVNKRFAEVLEYIGPFGKLNSGLTTIASYKMLTMNQNLSAENDYLINILAWCTELLITSYCISDDISDGSTKRRGRLCWHLKEEIGMTAINDGHMVNCGLYLLLKKYFSGLPCYVPLLELFHEGTFEETVGQSLDATLFKNGKPHLESYTMSKITALAKYKVSSVLFRVPVLAALYFCNNYDREEHRRVENILLHLGKFCRIQDDILDYYGDSEITGKKGNDIREGKCSWLIVEALRKVTPSQRQILEINFGKQDFECENAILALYDELELLNEYLKYKKELHGQVHKEIKQLSDNRLKNLLCKLTDIYMKQEYFFK